MSVNTSTLVSRMKSSAAASAMPRSPAWGLTWGAFERMRSPLEAARPEGRPDAVHERGPARVAEPRRDDRLDLLHVHHVLGVAGPGAVLQLVPNPEAVRVVGGDLRRESVLVAHERGLP